MFQDGWEPLWQDMCKALKRENASRGFEPRSLDSESRVLTVTPRGQLGQPDSLPEIFHTQRNCSRIRGHQQLWNHASNFSYF